MTLILFFLAGALFCNCIPHLASGLQGMPFPTPFAKPRGVGLSSPLLNFFWGALNLFAGLAIVMHTPASFGPNWTRAVLVAGFVVLGSYLAIHFGKVRRDREGSGR